MPCTLYLVSVQETPAAMRPPSRLSAVPVKSSGSVILEGSRLNSSPCRLNGSGYSLPAV